MNWADIAILIILAISGLISLKRGFVKEALSLAAWVAAFFVAMFFYAPLSTLFTQSIASPSVRDMVAFGLLFAATLIVAAMVNYLIGEVVKMTGLKGTDRFFGVLFGLLRGFIVVMALLLLTPMLLPVHQEAWWQESILIPHFLAMEDFCMSAVNGLKSFIADLF